MKMSNNVAHVLELVRVALEEAYTKHPKLHPSLEHSLTVLNEEVRELETELFMQETQRTPARIEAEATQVAACAIRLVADMYTRFENS